MALAACIKRKA